MATSVSTGSPRPLTVVLVTSRQARLAQPLVGHLVHGRGAGPRHSSEGSPALVGALIDRLASSGVAVCAVDDLHEARAIIDSMTATARGEPGPGQGNGHGPGRHEDDDSRGPICVLLDLQPVSSDDPEDIDDATRVIGEAKTALGAPPIVVTYGAPPRFLVECFRAGAADVIDLVHEGTARARGVVSRVAAAERMRRSERATVGHLRSVIDELLRDLVRTERRTIDLEDRLGAGGELGPALRVAVIDPDGERRARLGAALGARRVTSRMFGDGPDALADPAFPASSELIVVDAEAGDRDAAALVAAIHARAPAARVVLVAGEVGPELASAAAELGVAGLLHRSDTRHMAARIVEIAADGQSRARDQTYLERIKERHERVLAHYLALRSDAR